MKSIPRAASVAAAFALAVARLSSQTPGQKPSFDVISIKPSPPPSPGGAFRLGGGAQGDRFTMNMATLRTLLNAAYVENVPLTAPRQLEIIGGPVWMDSDRSDVQAKADCQGGSLPRTQLQLMVQSLLEDRFKLKAHMETRELPIYNLVTAKDGAKIKKSADQTKPAPLMALPGPCEQASGANTPPPFPPPGRGGNPFDQKTPPPRGTLMMSMGPNGMTLRATATPFANLVRVLQGQLGRTIVDKTGLEGLFDFELTYSAEGLGSPFGRGLPLPPQLPPVGGAGASAPAAADAAPSLFSAIQELGLKLESARGPIEVLVIDSVEKPTEN
jgi:uncharacterized protein (TIGR03435 family)